MIPDNTTSVAIGGASSLAASTWKTKSIVEVLDTILFPDQAPTYTSPNITLSGTATGTKEIGDTYSQSLTLTVIKNDAGTPSGLQITKNGTVISTSAISTGTTTDIIAQYGYTDPNNPNLYYRITASENNIVVTSGNVSWAGSSLYAAGLPKQNNKGVISTATYITTGTLNSSAVTVTGIYPWFWGVSSATSLNAATVSTIIQGGTSNKNLSDASGTISVTFNASSQFLWFALPATYANKTTWFNTNLNQGSIGAQQFMLSPITVSVTSPTSLWSNVSYKIYISYLQQTTSGAYLFS